MRNLATILLNWAQVSFCIAALVFAVISAQMASEKTAAMREQRRKAKCRDAGERLAQLSDAQIERLYLDLLRPGEFRIGTPANPILLPNGDRARYSTLAEMMRP